MAAVAMAAGVPGSRVVVLTDGLSNVGLGAMTPDGGEDAFLYAKQYYDRIATQAKEQGVAVSIVSIEVRTVPFSVSFPSHPLP
jgi:hypothetical protein